MLCKEIKKLGFRVKIDTNGTNPKLIKELVKSDLVDYIALDYKATKEKFEKITKNRNFSDFQQTLDFLIEEDFPFEARTTVHSNLLTTEDINKIIDDLKTRGYKRTYYLQNYLHVEDTVGSMQEQTNLLDISKIDDKLEIDFREF
jgi:pyruvate formate lyase activating enzyme